MEDLSNDLRSKLAKYGIRQTLKVANLLLIFHDRIAFQN